MTQGPWYHNMCGAASGKVLRLPLEFELTRMCIYPRLMNILVARHLQCFSSCQLEPTRHRREECTSYYQYFGIGRVHKLLSIPCNYCIAVATELVTWS